MPRRDTKSRPFYVPSKNQFIGIFLSIFLRRVHFFMWIFCWFKIFSYICSDSYSFWLISHRERVHTVSSPRLPTPKLWSNESRGKFTCILPSLDKGGTMFNGVGMRVAIYWKALLVTLCSWHSRIWQFYNSSQQTKQQWRPWVCNNHVPIATCLWCRHVCSMYRLHIGVGFGVARFDYYAMPELSSVRRVTGLTLTLFLYSCQGN